MDSDNAGPHRHGTDFMPPLDLQHIVFFLCVGVFTMAVVWSDLWLKKIPNKLNVPMFVAGLAYQGIFHGVAGLVDGLLAFLIAFGMFLVFWMIGISGGGDVKLVGALSVWVGRKFLLPMFFMTTVFVIVLHVGYLFYRLLTGGVRKMKQDLAQARSPETKSSGPFIAAQHRKKGVVMGYALPVVLAVWSVLLWKLPQL